MEALLGLFAASFAAATLCPLPSEAALFAYLQHYPDNAALAVAVATVGTVKLELERKLLGDPTGVVGLYAGNHTSLPIDVELRAFRVGP